MSGGATGSSAAARRTGVKAQGCPGQPLQKGGWQTVGMRVLVTTPGGLGHVLPMVPLAQAMAARGHQVLWALPDAAVANVERRGIRAVASGSTGFVGPAFVMRQYPEMAALAPAEVPDVMFGKLFGAIAAPAMLADLVPVALDWRPDLVVSDAAEFAGHIVAAELGVPSVTKGFGPLVPERRVAAAAVEVAPLWRSRGLEPRPYGGSYDHLYLDPYPPELQPQSAAHIPRRQLLQPVTDDDRGQEGLPLSLPEGSSDTPLVYVTMGTVFNDPGPLRVILAGLDDLDVRILVTVGPQGNSTVFGGLPPHVRIERYVPQMLVLPHCALVVSHGGSGTVLATLTVGLPQLCLPQGADQFLNASAVASSGAGLSLMPGQADESTVGGAANRLLGDPAFRDAARLISASIGAMPSPDDVAAVLEGLK